MKRVVYMLVLSVVVFPTFAATPAGTSRRTMSNKIMSAPRATASTNQISAAASAQNPEILKSSVRQEMLPAAPRVPDRQKEKDMCINNNVGIGNTFVWASRYSNTANYATMVEDVEQPENNVCFVKVGLKSTDSKIDVSDIPSQYYEWGRTITCGSWANEEKLRQRVLDAKKSARAWATVGGVVGGAGVGVGAMELFGNKIINGKVEGQYNKKLSDYELLRSQLLVLKSNNRQEFNAFMGHIKTLKTECEKNIWNGTNKPSECDAYDYTSILSINDAQ